MDVYTFGYLMTTQNSNTLFKETDFYNRLKKRNEINKQLNESVREIIHFTDSKNFMNNWIDLHDLIIDKVDHYFVFVQKKFRKSRQNYQYKREKNIKRNLEDEIQKNVHGYGANEEKVYDELMKYLCHLPHH